VAYARWLAYLTLGYNLLEGLVSMGFGWADGSLSLFGFGADSFIEVGSGLLVLWRLGAEGACASSVRLHRERRAAQGIGALLVALALGTSAGAILQLKAGRHPATTAPGLVVALLSLLAMTWLWRAKVHAAKALDSGTVQADAACSLACIQLSGVLFAGSLVCLVAPRLAWADAAAALALSVAFAKEGIGTLRAASRKDFQGGCGCH
jgi:hypothetical protein